MQTEVQVHMRVIKLLSLQMRAHEFIFCVIEKPYKYLESVGVMALSQVHLLGGFALTVVCSKYPQKTKSNLNPKARLPLSINMAIHILKREKTKKKPCKLMLVVHEFYSALPLSTLSLHPFPGTTADFSSRLGFTSGFSVVS